MSRNIIIKKDFNTTKNSWMISIEGELNAETTSQFEEQVKDAFFEKPASIQFDFKEVSVFVSAAVGTLLLINDLVTQANYKITINAINPKVKEVLSLIGIYEIFSEK